MDIRRYVAIVRRRLPLVLAIVVAALIAGWLITPKAASYTATTTLYVGSRSVDINPTSGQVSGDRVAGLDRLITTFSAMATSRPIAADAAKKVHQARSADQIQGNTTAQQVPETDLIDISVTDGNADVSRALADAVGTSLVEQIRAFEPRSADSTSEQVISLYEPATTPSHANPKGIVRNLVLAGLFGVLAAGALLALLEYLDVTLRSTDDVESQLELPVLAVVPGLGRRLPVAPAADAEAEAVDG
jgi:capsular polysaccharide biosynthesis protein